MQSLVSVREFQILSVGGLVSSPSRDVFELEEIYVQGNRTHSVNPPSPRKSGTSRPGERRPRVFRVFWSSFAEIETRHDGVVPETRELSEVLQSPLADLNDREKETSTSTLPVIHAAWLGRDINFTHGWT